jgi:nucleotide-binding universal stress UspA family protein
MSNRIVVGYDGSVSSTAAVEWAAREAVVRQAPLTLLACHPSRPSLGPAEAKVDELRRQHPTLECDAQARFGAPKDALVVASADAALMVVGKTGHGFANTLHIGSVATVVLHNSHCPTALVPRGSGVRRDSHVLVVGVDGSPAAEAALEWAIAEASIHGGELRIVHAWTYEYTRPAIESIDDHRAASEAARRMLDRVVDDVRTRAAGCEVLGVLVEGSGAWALVEEAATADLVVVGSRGLGGLRSMLLGSVANAVTERAPCPTVVVHRPGRG